jgi:hypothetical protein
MSALKKSLLAWVCLQFTSAAFAADAGAPKPTRTEASRAAAVVPPAERYARRCVTQAPDRADKPQGTLLWGTKRRWDSRAASDDQSSVLVSVGLEKLVQGDAEVKGLRLEGGRLVASSAAAASVVGSVLQGTASDGKPVEVAICGAEPASDDPSMVWYRVEAWNPVAQEWENPCAGTGRVPNPRALAVGGVWDASGAHRQDPGKLTFACENGAITKCVTWGYKPWASRNGQSLAELHQACTRMARADYCGNGRSHTRDNTTIDIYDSAGVMTPATEASADWDPARGSFEAAWAPDGATCMARARDGRTLDSILKECPGRFDGGSGLELGDGDRCAVQRAGLKPAAVLLRNRSYGASRSAVTPGEGK